MAREAAPQARSISPAPAAARRQAADHATNETLADTLAPADLWAAARAGDTRHTEEFIQQGSSVDSRDSYGRTALMLAAMNGHAATVQKLLALGADATVLDRDGLSAAQHAKQHGHARVAELLGAGR